MKPAFLQLQQLLEKETWTEEEVQWMEVYLQKNASPELYSLLEEAFKNDFSNNRKLDPSVSARMRERIFSAANLHENAPLSDQTIRVPRKTHIFSLGVHSPSTRTRQIAAAVLLLVISSLATYVLLTKKKEGNAPVPQVLAANHPKAIILPGGDKAVLQLANGSVVVLDSAHDGNLVDQGSTKLSKRGGKLSYVALASGDVPQAITYNVLTTPKGGQYQVVLPDGTRVWLNAASSLKFPTSFSGKDRQVEMTGEAYFEVAKDKDKPFRVLINHHIQAQVLGTSFNVMAYEEEPAVNTTLVEGSVRLVKELTNVLLKPGQQGALGPDGTDFTVSEANVEDALAWKNGLCQFNKSSIETIMRQIARWYDVDISYQVNLQDQVYSGSMPRKENIEQLLKILEYTGTVHFIIDGRKIIVTK